MADASKLLGTDTLRTAYPKINQMIDNTNTFQAQLDQMTIDGDSSVEAAQARVKADGTTFTTLQERLNNSDTRLADIAINIANFPIQSPETDDTARLQRAIDYAGANGLKLLIPKGTYYFSSTLNITYENLKIIGERGKTILKYKGTGRALSFDQGGVIGTTTYGTSLTGFELIDLTISADFTQTFDVNSNPTSWYPATALYLNGARNFSVVENCKFEGFERAVHAVFNWMCNYKNNWFLANKEGLFLEDECNNVTISDNIFRRCGNVTDFSGYACKVKGSYAIVSLNNDVEQSNCVGFIYENSHAFTHIGGDIENNDKSTRKIQVKGREGATLTDREKWSYGGEIIGVRFRNTLGIEFLDGSRNIRVGGCTFSDTGTKNGLYAIRIGSSATLIENISIGQNDFYGDNLTYLHGIPFSMIASSDRKKLMLESPDLDVTNVNALPIGFFEKSVKITKLQLVVYQTASTGTCTVDIGVGDNIASIKLDAPFTGGGAVTSAPYGVYDVTGYTADQVSGVVRARVQDNTMASGKIRVRIFYETI